ncbi:MAG: disulfide bond formation protein B [Pseudomonadota bacterium]
MNTRRTEPDLYPVDEAHAKVAAGIIVACAVILAIAWGFELIGGFMPCKLCLEQREGYYTAIPLLAVALTVIAMQGPACATRGLMAVAGLALAMSMVTGLYQAGAEWGWWLGPNDCGTGAGPTVSGSSLLDEIAETTIIFCDEAPIRILGLSFAGWNVLVAGPLAALALLASLWPPKSA